MSEATALRVADLPQNAPTAFDLRPDAREMQALADELGLVALRKLRFAGTVAALGARDWELRGRLGATVVQPCVVTLDPVTTRIDTDITRRFVAGLQSPQGEEVEMPDDETESLGPWIDPGTVMAEALALALPQYPRAEGADLDATVFAAPGTEPLRDEDMRPFAGLAALKDTQKKPD